MVASHLVASQPVSEVVASPPPFPEGWYFVASRDELERAGLIQKRWMGAEIVVWRNDRGQVSAAESWCPHLGSSLGPEAGGRVREGRLVCPFHGFEFDAEGQCTRTPFAAPPRSARLRVFETREINGLVFAWSGMGGREPQWRLPEGEPDQSGWSGARIWRMRFRGHPQDTTENAVDLAHLRYVHGYRDVEAVEAASMDGPRLEARFNFRRRSRLTRWFRPVFEVSARAIAVGLGYSLVEYRERVMGIEGRLWALATPVDGERIDFTLVSQVRDAAAPERRVVGLQFLPRRLRLPLLNWLVASQQRQDVNDDVAIWSRKRYLARPRLCRSDGKIMAYRAWCAQFYPVRDESVAVAGSSAALSEAGREGSVPVS